MANCKVIAVTNQKGSVGKTTTTAMSWESVLRTYINAVKLHYDYILKQSKRKGEAVMSACDFILHLSAQQGKARW